MTATAEILHDTVHVGKTANEAGARQNAIHWFEIPCADLERAVKFYETMLHVKLNRTIFGDSMAIFPYANGGTGGALVQRNRQKPGPDGAVVFLNCNGKLDAVLSRVSACGGLILQSKTEIEGGFGWYACVRDSEGNHVGLHSV